MKNFGTFFAFNWQCDMNGTAIGRNCFAREGNIMFKRLLILILLVIILVSLNWFKVVVAQDLSSMSEKEKKSLLEKYKREFEVNSKDSLKNNSNYYKSPEIYDTLTDEEKINLLDNNLLDDSLKAKMPLKYQILNDSIDSTNVLDKEKESVGLTPFEELKPFGMEFFEVEQKNEKPIELASASDYILGPGDNVIIYLWGRVDKELNLTVDREGKIFIQKIGEVVAWGLTMEQFTQKVKKKLSQSYSDFQITVSLGKIRSIRIFVSGEVKKPGAYTVSSLTSVLNALYHAEGINERGSLRNIKLMRNGKTKAVIDLYDFMLKGDNTNNIRLESNDVVFVPVAKLRVAIRGEINREAIYELKKNETALNLLELAGNAKPTAHLDHILLERVVDRTNWVVIDLNLNSESEIPVNNEILQDGDRLTINGIFDLPKNKISIFGKVEHPGYYERKDSTRLADLLRQAKLQPYDVYMKRANIFRRYTDWRTEVIAVNINEALKGNPDHNLLLKDQDSVYVNSIDEVLWDRWVYVDGSVKNPGEYKLYENMTVNDLIFLAGSYNREASRHQAEVARLDSLGNVSLIYVSLTNNQASQTLLHDGDHLYIRQIPEWQSSPVVSIEGKVKYPGEYMLTSREETLYQLLERAGGFTQNAFPTGLVLERESIGDNLERNKIRGLVNNSQPLTTDSLGNTVKQNLFEYDPSSLNRIIIDINRLISSKGKQGDIVLEPNDRLYIPSIPSGIAVMGAVGSNGTIKFTPGLKAKDYIKRAGNFTKRSDKEETKLIRANGEILSGGKALGQKVKLGDIIFVPSKIKKERYFLKTFTEVLTATTSLLTTVYIVSKL